MRYVLASAFAFAGIMHFIKESIFLAIMPEWVPAPALMVQLSGIAEILGGVGLLVPVTRKWAALGLILLLVAVFPANINMALNPSRFPQIPEAALWARLPFQFALIWLTWMARK